MTEFSCTGVGQVPTGSRQREELVRQLPPIKGASAKLCYIAGTGGHSRAQ